MYISLFQYYNLFRYDDENEDKVGIIRLLSNGVFAAAYPLHDGLAVKDDSSGSRCSRRVSLMNFSVANSILKI